MTNEIIITAEQIERLVKERNNKNEMWRKANRDGRKETANRHLDNLIGMEIMLDIIGIEYED